MKALYSPSKRLPPPTLFDDARLTIEDINSLLSSLKHREEDYIQILHSIEKLAGGGNPKEHRNLKEQIREFESHRRHREDQIIKKYLFHSATDQYTKKMLEKMYTKVQQLMALAKQRILEIVSGSYSKYYVNTILNIEKKLLKLRTKESYSLDDALKFILNESRIKYDSVWTKYVAQVERNGPTATKIEISLEQVLSIPTQRDQSDTQRTLIETKKQYTSQINIDSQSLMKDEQHYRIISKKKVLKGNELSIVDKDKDGLDRNSGLKELISPKSSSKNVHINKETQFHKPAMSYQVLRLADLPFLSANHQTSNRDQEAPFKDSSFKKSKHLSSQHDFSQILPTQKEENMTKGSHKEGEEVFQRKFQYLKKQSHLQIQTDNSYAETDLAKTLKLPPLTNFPELRKNSVPNPKDEFVTLESEYGFEKSSKALGLITLKPKHVQSEPIHINQSKISQDLVSPKTNVYSIIGKVKYKAPMADSGQKQEEEIEKIYNRLVEANSQIKKEREQFLENYYKKYHDQKLLKARRQKLGLKSISRQVSKTTLGPSGGRPEFSGHMMYNKTVDKKAEHLRKLFYTSNGNANHEKNNEDSMHEKIDEKARTNEDAPFGLESYLNASFEGFRASGETDNIRIDN